MKILKLKKKVLYQLRVFGSVSAIFYMALTVTRMKETSDSPHHHAPPTVKRMNELEGYNAPFVTKKKNQISAYKAPPGVNQKNDNTGNKSYQTSRFESGYKYCNLDPMSAYPKTLLDQQTTGLFQNVTGIELYVYSAFIVSKSITSHIITVLAAGNLEKRDQIYIQIYLSDGKTISHICEYSVLNSEVQGYSNFNSYYLNCPIPANTGIIFISITSKLCENPGNTLNLNFVSYRKKEKEIKIAICHPPLRGIESPYAMLEWLQYQKQMGVSKVIFSGIFNISTSVYKVINYFNEVEIRAWGTHNNDSRFDSPALDAIASNDCLYRNSGKYSYLMFTRVGEFIFPKGENVLNYRSLIKLLKNKHRGMVSNFVLPCARFCTDWEYGKDTRSILLTMSSFRTSSKPLPLTTSIVNPRGVKRMFRRHPAEVGDKFHPNVTISRQVALVHKYSPFREGAVPWKLLQHPCRVVDKTALRFKRILITSINNVLRILNLKLLDTIVFIQ